VAQAGARPAIITPEQIVVVGDVDAVAMARVVDLVLHENGTIVHVDVLPGAIGSYRDAAARATDPPD
jgi:hypothetical protein